MNQNLFDSSGDSLSRERAVKKWVEFPFANVGDTTTKIYKQQIEVNEEAYQPPQLGKVHAKDQKAVFVGDTTPSISKPSLVSFVRSHAYVPQSWTEYITYNWQAPGLAPLSVEDWFNCSQGLFLTNQNDAVAVAFYEDFLGWPAYDGGKVETHALGVSDASGFSVGQSVVIEYNANVVWYDKSRGYGPIRRERAHKYTDTATIIYKSGNTLYFMSGNDRHRRLPADPLFLSFPSAYALVHYFVGVTYSDFRLGIKGSREQTGVRVTAKVAHDYVYETDASNIKLTQPIRFIDPGTKDIGGITVSNWETDILTDTTQPTVAQYREWVDSKQWIQVEHQQLSRWMGNIWELQTIFVQAV